MIRFEDSNPWKKLYKAYCQNHLDYYLKAARTSQEIVVDEADNILACWDWAIEKRNAEECVELWRICWKPLQEDGKWQDIVERTLKIVEDNKLKLSSEDRNKMILAVGNLYMVTGRFGQAEEHLMRAKELIGFRDKKELANIYTSLGVLYRRYGRWNDAIENLQLALKINKSNNNMRDTSLIYIKMGAVYRQSQKFDLAISCFNDAYELILEISPLNINLLSIYYNAVGNYYSSIKNLDLALNYYNKALRLRNSLGQRYEIAVALNNIGGIYSQQNNPDEALVYWRKAETIYTELKAFEALVVTWRSIAQAYVRKGLIDDAETYYLKSIKQAEHEKSALHLMKGKKLLGQLYITTNQVQLARSNLETSLAIAKQLQLLSDESEIAAILNSIG